MRRRLLLAMALAPALTAAAADEAAWTAVARPGAIVLMRHANAPGVGDPTGMRLGACATQRNLDAQGRGQARQLGEQFRRRGVRVGAVLSSQWCRTLETAQLAFGPLAPQGVREEAAFNSFFGGQGSEAAQTAAARELLRRWQGPGALVVVTHQVNITALTGVWPAAGEALVVGAPQGDRPLPVLGRLKAD
jgi:broad specificity phosphatase PhoE